jgi:rubredoxin
MIVNLKCEECRFIYDAEVGEPRMDDDSGSLLWEHPIICPNCKALDKDLLTEIGQSQMTEWFFSF